MDKNILIIGDLHTGVRKDDPKIESIIVDFFDQAIEYSKKNKIKTWIQTGDWFDVRSAISHITMELMSKTLIPKIREAGIFIHVLVGNHDMKHKHVIRPNACEEVLGQYDDVIKVYAEPGYIEVQDEKIDLIPWMCEENIEDILAYIRNSDAKYCVGHWELNGYYFYKNQPSSGYDPSFLSGYKQVYSGHFHTISDNKNVLYVGTPYTITYGDTDDQRGFWDLNAKTGKHKFIENSKMWHSTVEYPECIENGPYDFSKTQDCYVKLIVNCEDSKELDKFELDLSKTVYELRTVRSQVALNSIFGFDDTVDETVDKDGNIVPLETLMKSYVDGMSISTEDKALVKTELESLFNLCKGE